MTENISYLVPLDDYYDSTLETLIETHLDIPPSWNSHKKVSLEYLNSKILVAMILETIKPDILFSVRKFSIENSLHLLDNYREFFSNEMVQDLLVSLTDNTGFQKILKVDGIKKNSHDENLQLLIDLITEDKLDGLRFFKDCFENKHGTFNISKFSVDSVEDVLEILSKLEAEVETHLIETANQGIILNFDVGMRKKDQYVENLLLEFDEKLELALDSELGDSFDGRQIIYWELHAELEYSLRKKAKLKSYFGRSHILLKAPDDASDDLSSQYRAFSNFIANYDVRLLEQDNDQALFNITGFRKFQFLKIMETLDQHGVTPVLKKDTLQLELVVYLAILRHGFSTTLAATFFQKGTTSINKILHLFNNFFCAELYHKLAVFPPTEGFAKESTGRIEEFGFAHASVFDKHCVGAIDGVQINIFVTESDKESSFNWKSGRFGLNVPVVCDFNRRLLFSHCGFRGVTNDMGGFIKAVSKKLLNFSNLNQFLIGDQGYGIGHRLLIPHRFGASSAHIVDYINRLSAVAEPTVFYNLVVDIFRNSIERMFGVIRRKFKILRNDLEMPISTSVGVIYSCFTIYNFLLKFNHPSDINSKYGAFTDDDTDAQDGNEGDAEGYEREKEEDLFFEKVTSYLSGVGVVDDTQFDWGGSLANKIVADYRQYEDKIKETVEVKKKEPSDLLLRKYGESRRWYYTVKLWYIFVNKISPNQGYALYNDNYYKEYKL